MPPGGDSHMHVWGHGVQQDTVFLPGWSASPTVVLVLTMASRFGGMVCIGCTGACGLGNGLPGRTGSSGRVAQVGAGHDQGRSLEALVKWPALNIPGEAALSSFGEGQPPHVLKLHCFWFVGFWFCVAKGRWTGQRSCTLQAGFPHCCIHGIFDQSC